MSVQLSRRSSPSAMSQTEYTKLLEEEPAQPTHRTRIAVIVVIAVVVLLVVGLGLGLGLGLDRASGPTAGAAARSATVVRYVV
jgi:hypothetical protein